MRINVITVLLLTTCTHASPYVPELSQQDDSDLLLKEQKPLRALTSLNWPYIPEESAYPDPLKRNDPKPLQLHQYEAIGV